MTSRNYRRGRFLNLDFAGDMNMYVDLVRGKSSVQSERAVWI